MTTKKKKKSSNYIKQNEAHYKNIFFQKVLEIAAIVSETKSNKLISNQMLEVIYKHRIRSMKVVAAIDHDLPSELVHEAKETLVHYLKNNCFTFESGPKIDYYDFLGPGFSLWRYLDYLKKYAPDKYPQSVNDFSGFIEAEDMYRTLEKFIKDVCNEIAWKRTSLDKKIFSLKLTFKTSEENKFQIYPEVMVQGFSSQSINVCFNGGNRPAYRVGITSRGSSIVWIDLKEFAGTLGLRHLPPDTNIPVYIQHHALNRLKERIDCAVHSQILVNLANSITKKECVLYHGHWLIAYYLESYKIGYLMLDIVNNVAVIRTFLLLTHFDTPEGDSLREIIGLEKPDMSFLNLDKLSTFVFSGLRENKDLCDIFTRAGCGSLAEVPQAAFDKKNYTVSAAVIESYIGKYNDHMVRLRLEGLFAS